MEEVNRLVKQANGDLFDEHESSSEADDGEEEEFKGFEEPEPINQEDEYIDEDKYTTVTIESVGISKAGFSKVGEEADEERAEGTEEGKEGDGKKEKRVWTKEWPKNNKPKKKKVKFRYETKAERKAERMKQGAKKRKQKEARAKKNEK